MRCRRLLLLLCIGLTGFAHTGSAGFPGFDAISQLPPGAQFRQLSLMLLMSGQAVPDLNRILSEQLGAAPASSAPGAANPLMPDEYSTPLVRIVDQQSLVSSAIALFGFVEQNTATITEKLKAIKAANPVLISMVDTREIMQDAIIIRNAVADSVQYLGYAGTEAAAGLLNDYRSHTEFLRNEAEYAEFYQELEKITDVAVNSMGGKMDAYQRMFDEEFESDSVENFMEATEFSTEKRARFDRRAARLTEEILQNVMDEIHPAIP